MSARAKTKAKTKTKAKGTACRTMHTNTVNALNASLKHRADVPISLPAVATGTAGDNRPFCVAPPGTSPCAAVTLPPVVSLQATGGLSPVWIGWDLARPDESGPLLGLTTLADRTRHQCCFPLWSNTARPGDPDYGRVCGADVAPAKPGERAKSYCAHHEGVVTGSHAETQKAKRIVRATVRTARAQGAA